jgi:hypothetical protein
MLFRYSDGYGDGYGDSDGFGGGGTGKQDPEQRWV